MLIHWEIRGWAASLGAHFLVDEASDGLGPAPNGGDIVFHRFGPEMPRECASTGFSRWRNRSKPCGQGSSSLSPLGVPNYPWEIVGMDFVTDLPKSS